jgi:hypothetical protein
MTYSPAVPRETETHRFAISPWSRTSDILGLVQDVGGGVAASQAWPVANQAYGWPFQLNERQVVYEAFYAAGATAGGNFDIGIFDTAGNLIVNTGLTARVVSAHTNVALTDTTLEPGRYYACMTADATSNYAGWIPAAGLCEACGLISFADAPAFAATATFARTTAAFIPYFGFSCNSVSV